MDTISILLGEPFPECVKKILFVCGYDTIASLRNVNNNSILEIEHQTQLYFRETIHCLTCCHSEFYNGQDKFEFLPGHRELILAIPEYVKSIREKTITTQNEAFSTVHNALNRTALQNFNRDVNHAQYDDVIRFFSTYIFLNSGRSCYEVLNHNLPMPSTRTLCKLKEKYICVTSNQSLLLILFCMCIYLNSY